MMRSGSGLLFSDFGSFQGVEGKGRGGGRKEILKGAWS